MLLLPATVTAAEARDTLRMLSQALQRVAGPVLTVDASGLKRFDSSVIAVLLECQRLAHAWGKRFTIKQPPAKLSQLATLYGVDELMLGDTAHATAI